MKPEDQEPKEDDGENPTPPVGDAIGDTTYSERFVLKILLKLANLDTLKDEILDKAFEEDLCTLWDMTAERDVVLFLIKHDVLNLLNFALPIVDSPRIIEIVVGVVGNMCCQKEAVASLLKMESFLTAMLHFLESDDSLVLVQVVRLISSCLFVADDDDLAIWMKMFKSINYSKTLFFILNNSTHKELLMTTLENFNTIAAYYNKEKFRIDFFSQFVTSEALESLSAAYTEVMSQKEKLQQDSLERIMFITFQIIINLVGFEKSPEIYKNIKEELIKVIAHALSYYENKFVNHKEIDSDLIDIVDSSNTVVKVMSLSEKSEPESYFTPACSIWKSLKLGLKCEQTSSNFETDTTSEELQEFATKIKPSLSTLICHYLDKCPEKHLNNVLDEITEDYEDMITLLTDEDLKNNVTNRASNYRTRLKDNVDS